MIPAMIGFCVFILIGVFLYKDVMQTVDLKDKYIKVFESFFSENPPAKKDRARGGKDYYGVEITNVYNKNNQVVVELTLVFRTGKTYCCYEDECHHGWDTETSDTWKRLKHFLNHHNCFPARVKIYVRTRIEIGSAFDVTGNTTVMPRIMKSNPYEKSFWGGGM